MQLNLYLMFHDGRAFRGSNKVDSINANGAGSPKIARVVRAPAAGKS
jgi:hypothetical protein